MRPPAPRPLTPLFDNKKRYGSIDSGNTPVGTLPPPPCTPMPAVLSFLDEAGLGGALSVVMYGTNHVAITGLDTDAFAMIDVSDPYNPVRVGYITSSTQLDQAWGIAVKGNHAFVCARLDSALTAIDISNPAAPTIVSSLINTVTLSNCQYPIIDGNYAYITTFSNRLVVVDITNPTAMTIVGSVQDATNLNRPWNLVKVGNYLFVAVEDGNRVTVIDVTNPAAPTVVASVIDSVRLLDIQALAYRDGHIFAAGWSNHVTSINVTNPLAPVITGFIQDTGFVGYFFGVYGMAIDAGGYLHIPAYSGNRMTVIDISNPAAMTIVNSLHDTVNLSDPMNVCFNGRYAYVPRDHNIGVKNFTVLDIGCPVDPPLPTTINRTVRPATITTTTAMYATTASSMLITGVATGGGMDVPQSVVKDGNYCFIASRSGMDVVNVSNPAAPSWSNRLTLWSTINSQDIVQDGTLCYVSAPNRLAIVDVTNPLAPTVVSSLFDSLRLGGAGPLAKDGNYLYISGSLGGGYAFAIYDVSVPATPTFVGFENTITGPRDLVKVGNYCFVARGASPGSLYTMDVSNPAAPFLAATLTSTLLQGARGLVVDGNYAYMSASGRFAVVNITNPLAATIAGSTINAVFGSSPQEVLKDGNLCYVADAVTDRIVIVDVTNPAAPVVIDRITNNVTLNGAAGMTRDATHLFVAASVNDSLTVVSY